MIIMMMSMMDITMVIMMVDDGCHDDYNIMVVMMVRWL